MTDFSAEAPALGYYYQIQYGLYLLISSDIDLHENSSLSFETLDDVVIEEFNITKLHQLKYHVKKEGNLTNRSTDLWKTIRVWSEGIWDGTINPDSTIFSLVTTQVCPDYVLLGKFRNGSISKQQLIDELSEIAKETDNNATNKPGYEAFSRLSDDQKQVLIEKLHIVDSSKDFPDLEKEIKAKLQLSVLPNNLSVVYERLIGWWLESSINILKSNEIKQITYKALNRQIVTIIDEFKADNLPVDVFDKVDISDDLLINFSTTTFVKQLKLIGLGERSIGNSIQDYVRTFKQRARWSREDMINPSDEERYELELRDDWKSKFDISFEDLEDESDAELKLLGKSFYKEYYVKSCPAIYIKREVTQLFLVRGSYHILSNKKQVGWHPNYIDKL